MSKQLLLEALHGPNGSLDNYLEIRKEAEIKADILALADGSTLRDYFAAKAMQSLLRNVGDQFVEECDTIAKLAYEWADAMLKARETK